jgi:hypothetical protein
LARVPMSAAAPSLSDHSPSFFSNCGGYRSQAVRTVPGRLEALVAVAAAGPGQGGRAVTVLARVGEDGSSGRREAGRGRRRPLRAWYGLAGVPWPWPRRRSSRTLPRHGGRGRSIQAQAQEDWRGRDEHGKEAGVQARASGR